MSILPDAGRLGSMAFLPLALVAGSSAAPIPRFGTPLAPAFASAQERNCPMATVPQALPDVATIVNVDTLRPELAAELAQAPAAARLLFSIRFKPNGQKEWVEPIGGQAESEALHARVASVIARHIKSQAPAEPWSLRLQVVSAEVAQLHLSHSRVCPVELERPRVGARLAVTSMSRADLESLQQAGPARLAIHVSATGTVLRVDFLQRSGSHVADDNMTRSARANRYRPAMVDGIPVAGRYVFETRPFVRPN